jgi:8-hydroxy-5-deazaflavin:NADPH oxidoreductase
VKKPNSSVPALLTRTSGVPTASIAARAESRSVTSLRPLEVHVADQDFGSLGGEPRRDRGADPARAAGDQRLASLQPHRARSIDWPAVNAERPSAGTEPIPIIGGTGALGAGLALRWAAAGRPLAIGSRSAERAEEAAGRIRDAVPGAEVEGLFNEEAAKRADVVFLTVPFRAQSENLNNLRGALQPGQILVDCTVPLAAAVSGKATRSLGVWQGSAAQQAQEMVPDGVTVVAALHTIAAPTLADLGAELDEDVLVCGDRKVDKARVAGLIELIAGLRAVNAGPLETARIVEQLTPLLISVNARYKTHAGIKLTGLPDGDHWA